MVIDNIFHTLICKLLIQLPFIVKKCTVLLGCTRQADRKILFHKRNQILRQLLQKSILLGCKAWRRYRCGGWSRRRRWSCRHWCRGSNPHSGQQSRPCIDTGQRICFCRIVLLPPSVTHPIITDRKYNHPDPHHQQHQIKRQLPVFFSHIFSPTNKFRDPLHSANRISQKDYFQFFPIKTKKIIFFPCTNQYKTGIKKCTW